MRAEARRVRLTMRRRCVPGQPREVKRGAQTGPRVRQWKRRRGARFPFWFDSMTAIIATALPMNRALEQKLAMLPRKLTPSFQTSREAALIRNPSKGDALYDGFRVKPGMTWCIRMK